MVNIRWAGGRLSWRLLLSDQTDLGTGHRDTAPPIGGTNCDKPPYTPAQWGQYTLYDVWHYILVKNEENTVLVFILILHYFVENFTAIQPNKCRCLPTVYIKSFKILNEAYVKSKICMYISKKLSQFSVTLPKCWTTNAKFATRWFWWCRQSIEGGQLQMALPTTRGKMESIQSDMK